MGEKGKKQKYSKLKIFIPPLHSCFSYFCSLPHCFPTDGTWKGVQTRSVRTVSVWPTWILSVVRSCTALNPPMNLDYWTVLQFCIPGFFDHLLWNQLPLNLCLSHNWDVLSTAKLTKLKKKQTKLQLTNADIIAVDSKFEGFFSRTTDFQTKV